VVDFTEPVEGPGELSDNRCKADRHRFAATGIAPGVDETLFLTGDEIVERWPTQLVAKIEWFRPGRGDGAYTLAAKRQSNPNAYERWTTDEEVQLRLEHAAGLLVADIAAAHGRNQGAVRSRLQRLGLNPDPAAVADDPAPG
jgi:hypothetical protein